LQDLRRQENEERNNLKLKTFSAKSIRTEFVKKRFSSLAGNENVRVVSVEKVTVLKDRTDRQ